MKWSTRLEWPRGLKILLECICGAFFAFIFGIAALAVGASLGGNGIINIYFAGLQGYESAGLLGGIFGVILGSILGVFLGEKLLYEKKAYGAIIAGSALGGFFSIVCMQLLQSANNASLILLPLLGSLTVLHTTRFLQEKTMPI